MITFLFKGEFFETMYKGLALDEDVIDGGDKSFHLNKRLLDHFRDLASSNQDTDEVRGGWHLRCKMGLKV